MTGFKWKDFSEKQCLWKSAMELELDSALFMK